MSDDEELTPRPVEKATLDVGRKVSDDLSEIDVQIGDTAFSKAFVTELLVKLVEEVKRCSEKNGEVQQDGDDPPETISPRYVEIEAAEDASSPKDVETPSNDGAERTRDDTPLEQQCCALWDMTTNECVVGYLRECGICELLVALLAVSEAKRLQEIAVGILANIAQFSSFSSMECDQVIQAVVQTLHSPDSPTLVQTFRFLSSAMTPHGDAVLAALRANGALEQLVFILRSSRDTELLSAVAVFFDDLIDDTDQTEDAPLYSVEAVAALNEALRELLQRGMDDVKPVCYLLHSMHTVLCNTLHANTMSAICNDDLRRVTKFLFTYASDQEVFKPVFVHGYLSLISVWNLFLTQQATNDEQNMRNVLRQNSRMLAELASSDLEQKLLTGKRFDPSFCDLLRKQLAQLRNSCAAKA